MVEIRRDILDEMVSNGFFDGTSLDTSEKKAELTAIGQGKNTAHTGDTYELAELKTVDLVNLLVRFDTTPLKHGLIYDSNGKPFDGVDERYLVDDQFVQIASSIDYVEVLNENGVPSKKLTMAQLLGDGSFQTALTRNGSSKDEAEALIAGKIYDAEKRLTVTRCLFATLLAVTGNTRMHVKESGVTLTKPQKAQLTTMSFMAPVPEGSNDRYFTKAFFVDYLSRFKKKDQTLVVWDTDLNNTTDADAAVKALANDDEATGNHPDFYLSNKELAAFQSSVVADIEDGESSGFVEFLEGMGLGGLGIGLAFLAFQRYTGANGARDSARSQQLIRELATKGWKGLSYAERAELVHLGYVTQEQAERYDYLHNEARENDAYHSAMGSMRAAEEGTVVKPLDYLDDLTAEVMRNSSKGVYTKEEAKVIESDVAILTVPGEAPNNILYIADPGAGKTHRVWQVVRYLNDNADEIFTRTGMRFRVYSLNVGKAIAGTQYRGMAEARFMSVLSFATDRLPANHPARIYTRSAAALRELYEMAQEVDPVTDLSTPKALKAQDYFNILDKAIRESLRDSNLPSDIKKLAEDYVKFTDDTVRQACIKMVEDAKVEAEKRSGEIPVIFVDELHNVAGAGSSSGGGPDLANLMKTELTGNMRSIGATTGREAERLDGAMQRRYVRVNIKASSDEEAVTKIYTRLTNDRFGFTQPQLDAAFGTTDETTIKEILREIVYQSSNPPPFEVGGIDFNLKYKEGQPSAGIKLTARVIAYARLTGQSITSDLIIKVSGVTQVEGFLQDAFVEDWLNRERLKNDLLPVGDNTKLNGELKDPIAIKNAGEAYFKEHFEVKKNPTTGVYELWEGSGRNASGDLENAVNKGPAQHHLFKYQEDSIRHAEAHKAYLYGKDAAEQIRDAQAPRRAALRAQIDKVVTLRKQVELLKSGTSFSSIETAVNPIDVMQEVDVIDLSTTYTIEEIERAFSEYTAKEKELITEKEKYISTKAEIEKPELKNPEKVAKPEGVQAKLLRIKYLEELLRRFGSAESDANKWEISASDAQRLLREVAALAFSGSDLDVELGDLDTRIDNLEREVADKSKAWKEAIHAKGMQLVIDYIAKPSSSTLSEATKKFLDGLMKDKPMAQILRGYLDNPETLPEAIRVLAKTQTTTPILEDDYKAFKEKVTLTLGLAEKLLAEKQVEWLLSDRTKADKTKALEIPEKVAVELEKEAVTEAAQASGKADFETTHDVDNLNHEKLQLTQLKDGLLEVFRAYEQIKILEAQIRAAYAGENFVDEKPIREAARKVKFVEIYKGQFNGSKPEDIKTVSGRLAATRLLQTNIQALQTSLQTTKTKIDAVRGMAEAAEWAKVNAERILNGDPKLEEATDEKRLLAERVAGYNLTAPADASTAVTNEWQQKFGESFEDWQKRVEAQSNEAVEYAKAVDGVREAYVNYIDAQRVYETLIRTGTPLSESEHAAIYAEAARVNLESLPESLQGARGTVEELGAWKDKISAEEGKVKKEVEKIAQGRETIFNAKRLEYILRRLFNGEGMDSDQIKSILNNDPNLDEATKRALAAIKAEVENQNLRTADYEFKIEGTLDDWVASLKNGFDRLSKKLEHIHAIRALLCDLSSRDVLLRATETPPRDQLKWTVANVDTDDAIYKRHLGMNIIALSQAVAQALGLEGIVSIDTVSEATANAILAKHPDWPFTAEDFEGKFRECLINLLTIKKDERDAVIREKEYQYKKKFYEQIEALKGKRGQLTEAIKAQLDDFERALETALKKDPSMSEMDKLELVLKVAESKPLVRRALWRMVDGQEPEPPKPTGGGGGARRGSPTTVALEDPFRNPLSIDGVSQRFPGMPGGIEDAYRMSMETSEGYTVELRVFEPKFRRADGDAVVLLSEEQASDRWTVDSYRSEGYFVASYPSYVATTDKPLVLENVWGLMNAEMGVDGLFVYDGTSANNNFYEPTYLSEATVHPASDTAVELPKNLDELAEKLGVRKEYLFGSDIVDSTKLLRDIHARLEAINSPWAAEVQASLDSAEHFMDAVVLVSGSQDLRIRRDAIIVDALSDGLSRSVSSSHGLHVALDLVKRIPDALTRNGVEREKAERYRVAAETRMREAEIRREDPREILRRAGGR